MTGSKDLLTVAEVARRSGFAPSALRFYEREGLIAAIRTSGNQRRYERHVLRRLAFIRAARNIGLTLEEVRDALARLPSGRTPSRSDWAAISRSWRSRLDEQIEALEKLRDGLESCIGCGCLSLRNCHISNPDDQVARFGPGAVALPRMLRYGDLSPAGRLPVGRTSAGRTSAAAPFAGNAVGGDAAGSGCSGGPTEPGECADLPGPAEPVVWAPNDCQPDAD